MAVSKQQLEQVRHGMDLEESLDLHVRRWRLRTAVAAILGVAIVLAALGIFGNGPLSSARVAGSQGELRYERFARFGNEMRLEVRITGAAGEVRVPLDYLARFKLDRVVPEPRSQRIANGALAFTFAESDGLAAHFHLVPRDPGLARTQVTVNGEALPLVQFIYP